MGFAREDTRKLQEIDLTTFKHMHRCRTYIYRYRFERHDRITNKMMIRLCWDNKARSGAKDLGGMSIWLGTNFPHKTQETIGRSLLEELGRCLDDRLTSDKELQAVAYGRDEGTEEHDLEKLGEDNGGKSVLFKQYSHSVGFIKLNMVVMFDVIKIIDET